jgi:hypothetical protein
MTLKVLELYNEKVFLLYFSGGYACGAFRLQ